MKVALSEIRSRCEAIFRAAGVSFSDAEIITDVLLETEMRGVFTHGFHRVPYYVNCLKKGGIQPKSELTVVSDTPSRALCDGEGGLGIILSYKAMRLAIEKAKKTGIGIVQVRGSHHFGAAGYYTGMCAAAGMLGMAMSNGDVLVAATGSRERTIGNNPFSFAAPAGKYGKMVYDIAMSYSSDKKIIKMAEEGKPCPPGWIIDKDGNDTTDASAYEKGGVLLPFGGYKGYGMAMMVETMAAALSGAAMTRDVHAWNVNPEQNGNVGHFFMAMDVTVPDFEARMETMITEIKSSEKAAGVTEIFFPGEIEANKQAACEAEGMVDVAEETLAAITETEKMLQIF
ncbi:MAG: Ldh family oxidoreductase [Ruminococcaceae bacterium]|nr:Ldh family oxidoreductase [Oscillospiraceae bacterium]